MKKKVMSAILLGSLSTALYAGGDIGEVVFDELKDLAVVVPVEEYPVVEVKEVVIPEVKVVKKEFVPEVKAPTKTKVLPQVKVEKEVDNNSKGFYGVVKALTIMGTKLHGHKTNAGYGMACDLGYRFGNGFETEVDIGYATNKLDHTGDKASYISSSWGLIYAYPITEKIGVFGKGGVVYEKERISALNINEGDTGFVYSGGLEYNFTPDKALVLELESSTIETLAGNTLSLGYMFNF